MIERPLRAGRGPRRSIAAAAGLAACLSLANAASAASLPAVGSVPPHPSAARVPDAVAPRAAPPEVDASSRNAVARARMLECGHQWNNMKRAGTASGTWKDFSRGCLAQR